MVSAWDGHPTVTVVDTLIVTGNLAPAGSSLAGVTLMTVVTAAVCGSPACGASRGGRKRLVRPSCGPGSLRRARRPGSPRGGGRSAWRSARGSNWRHGPRPGGTAPPARTCPRRRAGPGCHDPRGLCEHPRPILDDGEDEGQVHRLEAFVQEVERPRIHHPEVQVVHPKLRPPPVGSLEHAGAGEHRGAPYPHSPTALTLCYQTLAAL
jgi:hypothetical protein